MPNSRLLAIVTVLTCLGNAAGAQSAFSIDQLREIERLIIAGDCAGLRVYIADNPVLSRGSDPLAVELRNFASGVDQGLIECISLSDLDAQTTSVGSAAFAEQAY